MKRTYILFILAVLFSINYSRAGEVFNRHFIIVVDQTITDKSVPFSQMQMDNLYKSLRAIFMGETYTNGLDMESTNIPQMTPFDADRDAISLFSFCLTGSRNVGDYSRICNTSVRASYASNSSVAHYNEKIFSDICQSLISKRERYYMHSSHKYGSNTNDSLDAFFKLHLYPIFSKKDIKFQKLQNESGISLSHFVYPLVLNFIPKDETANEYYIIVVSDFKSGQTSNNDEDDYKRLKELCPKNSSFIQYFKEQIKVLRSPFATVDYFHLQANGVGAKCYRLMMKSSIQKPELYMTSGLSIDEKSIGEFQLSKGIINFTKDELTSIDSISVIISYNDGSVLFRKVLCDEGYQIREHEILIDNINFENVNSVFEKADITYTVYTMSHDTEGADILPVALTISQSVTNITTINQSLVKAMEITLAVILVIALITILIFRGRKKCFSNLNVGHFAQKFVDVTEKEGALELPCWFFKEGELAQSIRIKGTISNASALSYGGNVKLRARLQDGSPSGISFYINGKDASHFVNIDLKNRDFQFNIDMRIDQSKLNVHTKNKCHVILDFEIESSLFGLMKHSDYIQDVEPIDFFLIHDLGNSWVGFDPGTTGSCVTVGSPGGTPDNPNVTLVNNDIIPSKLVLNKDISGSKISELEPGVDYVYGIAAEQNWAAHINAHRPCYQSIKKLLGYKNSKDDMIIANFGNKKMAFTGLDLAHLLVKGLYKDMSSHLDCLSENDRRRVAGKFGTPRRAVVAIPNNYTLPKILEMVDSIRRLNKFEEVRYIYEAEGILFSHFRKNYKEPHNKVENIVVYDMGGATINLSVFQVEYIENNGSTYYNIHTMGRIGYAVGGDNIDVALMEYLFTAKEVITQIKSARSRHDYQKNVNNKLEILRRVLQMKINIIMASERSNRLDVLGNAQILQEYMKNLIGSFGSITDNAFEDMTNVADEMCKRILQSSQMQHYVYSNVKDAVNEIIQYESVSSLNRIDKIIFAGRSTLFPGIKENVKSAFAKKFDLKSVKIYGGKGAQEVKTDVSMGACWYGINTSLITLDNSRLFGTYGFKLTTDGEPKLEILLNQNSKFDKDGLVYGHRLVENRFDSDGNVVEFYQVMGSGKGGKQLFDPENRHKINSLGYVDVTTTTSEISMSVDMQNKVKCEVIFETGHKVPLEEQVSGRDITKENDWAYIFAADTSYENGRPQSTTNRASANSQYKSHRTEQRSDNVTTSKNRY